MQLTLFDAICPTCLTPWSLPMGSFRVRLLPCSLGCL